MEFERKELFRALVGSHNYNLNDLNSDEDYKVFILPTFDDLYTKEMYGKCIITDEVDYDVHDIRHLTDLLFKSNINFMEVLFSNKVIFNEDINTVIKMYIDFLYFNKDNIAKMNLPYLFDACIGMHKSKKSQVDKGTSGTQHLVDEFGYDTKQAMHSIRVLDFLMRYAQNEFTDFKRAIYYNNDDLMRKHLLKLKHGEFTKQEYLIMSEQYFDLAMGYKDKYKSEKINENLKTVLIKSIKDIVKIGIMEE